MRRPRTTAAALLATALLALTACGGSDSAEGGSDGDDPGSFPTLESGGCEADVEITGDVEASFSGDASVETSESSGPPAFYQVSDDDLVLSIYASGNGFDATFLLSDGADGQYGGPLTGAAADAVSADGSGARIDADGDEVAGTRRIHVTATVTC